MCALLHRLAILLSFVFVVLLASSNPARGVAVGRRQGGLQVNKCGRQSSGEVLLCPVTQPCCSQHGYCGEESNGYCVVTIGCQPQFSADGSSPCDGGNTSIATSAIGACGVTEAGDELTCPFEEGARCCSASGACGQSSEHCSLGMGCQSKYGICWDEVAQAQGGEDTSGSEWQEPDQD